MKDLHSPLLAIALAALVLSIVPNQVRAADAQGGIEQALSTALADKRSVIVHFNGQTLGGAVTRVEAGLWVELRGPQSSRIVVRLDRIDAVVTP